MATLAPVVAGSAAGAGAPAASTAGSLAPPPRRPTTALESSLAAARAEMEELTARLQRVEAALALEGSAPGARGSGAGPAVAANAHLAAAAPAGAAKRGADPAGLESAARAYVANQQQKRQASAATASAHGGIDASATWALLGPWLRGGAHPPASSGSDAGAAAEAADAGHTEPVVSRTQPVQPQRFRSVDVDAWLLNASRGKAGDSDGDATAHADAADGGDGSGHAHHHHHHHHSKKRGPRPPAVAPAGLPPAAPSAGGDDGATAVPAAPGPATPTAPVTHPAVTFPVPGPVLRALMRSLLPPEFAAVVDGGGGGGGVADAPPAAAAAASAVAAGVGLQLPLLTELVPHAAAAAAATGESEDHSAAPTPAAPAGLAALESDADAVVAAASPSSASQARRQRVLAYLRQLAALSAGGEAFLHGAGATGTYVRTAADEQSQRDAGGGRAPEPVEVVVFASGGGGGAVETEWSVRLTEELCKDAATAAAVTAGAGGGGDGKSGAAPRVADVSFAAVAPAAVPAAITSAAPASSVSSSRVIRCTVDGLPVTVTANQPSCLAAAAYVEAADAATGHGHLFKRALILAKAWLASAQPASSSGAATGGKTSAPAAVAALTPTAGSGGVSSGGSPESSSQPLAWDWVTHYALAVRLVRAINAGEARGWHVSHPLHALALLLLLPDGDADSDAAAAIAASDETRFLPPAQLRPLRLWLAACSERTAADTPPLGDGGGGAASAAAVADPLAHWATLAGGAAVDAALRAARPALQTLLTTAAAAAPAGAAAAGARPRLTVSSLPSLPPAPPAFADVPSSPASPLACGLTYALLVCCRHYLSPPTLAPHALRLLAASGPLPVGFIGKALQDAVLGGGLPGRLKEAHGGLKTLMEGWAPTVVTLAADHPFNPTVALAPGLLAAAVEAAAAATASCDEPE